MKHTQPLITSLLALLLTTSLHTTTPPRKSFSSSNLPSTIFKALQPDGYQAPHNSTATSTLTSPITLSPHATSPHTASPAPERKK